MPSSIRGSAMNGSRAQSLSLAWRFAVLRTGGFPVIPTAIIVTVALVAILADAIAPHNPEVGTLGDRFRPPAWQAGRSAGDLPRTEHPRPLGLSRALFGRRRCMHRGFPRA